MRTRSLQKFLAPAQFEPEEQPRRKLSGPARVWILNGCIAALTAALYLLWVRDLPAPLTAVRFPWWGLAATFCVTEICVVHIQLRQHAHSFSLSEIPLVLGLVLVEPSTLVLAQLLGTAVALGVHRRQSPLKLVFNLAHFSLEACAAAIVFRAVAGDGAFSNIWMGAFVATTLASLLGVGMVFTAIGLSNGHPGIRQFRRALTFGLIAAMTNTSLGLISTTVLTLHAPATWLLFVPTATLFLAYQAYAKERRKHESLGFLYEATRIIHQSPRIESGMLALLSHARSVFRAEIAEITIVSGEESLRTTIGPGEEVALMQPVVTKEWPWPHVASAREAVFLSPNEDLQERFGCEVRTVIAAPIRGETRILGVMTIANRLGDITSFDAEDLKLLQTFVNHLGVWLENSQLERSLAELTNLKEQLKHQAFHDSLTGLANRELFTDRVEHAAARGERGAAAIAVLFLDLDDFKTINDSLGHESGDALLEVFAERLRSCLRPGDTAARLGGDEFALLLEGISGTRDAVAVAERIGSAVEKPFTLQGKEVTVGTSIGIALSAAGREGAGDLLRNADVAMYAAKSRGKNRYEIFQPSMHAAAMERLEIKEDLQRAVERKELVLHYQPIVELATGTITGVEALVRWNHPRRGLVPPNDFIPLAEETGLIHPIGRWVLNESCRQMRLWQARYPRRHPLGVSVNLSAKQLQRDGLTEEVASALHRAGLRPRSLILEITESALLDRDSTMRRLAELRALGVRVAIDDFGTGYSSLSYLNRFPIDILKVDRAFVREIGAAAQDEILAHAIIDLTTTLGLEAVAEGIETQVQGDRLQELGCRFGQGFLYSTPLDAQSIDELLRASVPVPVSFPAPARALA